MIHWGLYQSAAWSELWQPGIFVQSIALQALYLLFVVGPWRRVFPDAKRVHGKKMAIFFIGAWMFFFTFGSPLDYTSDHFLFSAHMLQHLMEILWMTPLLMVGVPDFVYRPLFAVKGLGHAMYALTKPIVAVIVFNVFFTAFHFPLLYDLTLKYEWFHFTEHLIFFITAFFLWWPILGIIPDTHALRSSKRMAYVFYNAMLSMPITVILIVATSPWYQGYVSAPRLIAGLSAIGDQQLGGVVMFISMVLTFGSIFFGTYLKYDNSEWYE